MTPSFHPPARPVVHEKDAFSEWLNRKKPEKIEAVEKAAEKAAEKLTIKSEEPFQPVQSPKMSSSKESINSNRFQGSMVNLNDTDAFVKHIETKGPSKNYGDPPHKAFRSPPQQASSSNGWQRPATAFDNPRWKLNDNTVTDFESYIKGDPAAPLVPSSAQGNTVYGSANVRAAKAQAAQLVAPKFQTAYQKPTFNVAQKLGRNVVQSAQNGPAKKPENIKPAQVVTNVEHVSPGLNSVASQKVENMKPAPAVVKVERAVTDPTNIVLKKPAVSQNNTQVKENEWQGMPSMQAVAAMISSDINNIRPEIDLNAPPLTQTALVLRTGFKTADQNENSDDRISSTGLDGVSSDYVLCSADPRHTQGNDTVEQLKDWDGAWGPAPVNWETERTIFDATFIPNYIKEWQQTLPSGLHSADIHCDKFTSGIYPLNNIVFVGPIDQGPDTIPGR